MEKNKISSKQGLLSKALPGLIVCLIVTLVGIYAADLLGIIIVNMKLLPEGSASPISEYLLLY